MKDNTTHIEELYLQMLAYDFMAETFDYPNQEFVKTLSSKEPSSGQLDFVWKLGQVMEGLVGSGLDETIHSLENYLNPFIHKQEELLLELQKDYTWACHASRPRLVPLFESVYKEGKLLQDSTFQINRLYYEAGLDVEKNFTLPPDHIAVQLEFMSFLCYELIQGLQANEQEIIEKARDLKKQVLEEHLGQFGKTFAQKFQKHGKTPFYKNMATCLEALLFWEDSQKAVQTMIN
jgi:TorA maturation chaperone TorD